MSDHISPWSVFELLPTLQSVQSDCANQNNSFNNFFPWQNTKGLVVISGSMGQKTVHDATIYRKPFWEHLPNSTKTLRFLPLKNAMEIFRFRFLTIKVKKSFDALTFWLAVKPTPFAYVYPTLQRLSCNSFLPARRPGRSLMSRKRARLAFFL